MRSDSLTPRSPYPRGLPSQRVAGLRGQEGGPRLPLEAPDLTEQTACPAAPSLRQIYLALILKMQLGLSFIAEIKQTGRGGGEPAYSSQFTQELTVNRLSDQLKWRVLISSFREEEPPNLPLREMPQRWDAYG